VEGDGQPDRGDEQDHGHLNQGQPMQRMRPGEPATADAASGVIASARQEWVGAANGLAVSRFGGSKDAVTL
jgi:hypothetical protein